ncbi:PREDICTED: mucin-5AC-like [Branchiostoma belcheri]|uniref:Mucin-5AC-like n=1 Tax=Branchiostoma belcheri TaxID=7741 RepID=A0A6P4Z447_BRABE|nr:PREDICTED: mucin-5AC-like [Branchiostoma belcheri]
MAGAPATTMAGAPASTMAGAPATTMAGAPATTMAGAPASTMSGAPASTMSGAPATTMAGAPATTMAGAPTTTMAGAPATTMAGAPTTTMAGAPSTTMAGAPATTTAGAPATTMAGAPASTMSGAPATTMAGAPATNNGWCTCNNNGWCTCNNYGWCTCNDNGWCTCNNNGWCTGTTIAGAPTSTMAGAPATTMAGAPATTMPVAPATTMAGAPATTMSGAPATDPVTTDNATTVGATVGPGTTGAATSRPGAPSSTAQRTTRPVTTQMTTTQAATPGKPTTILAFEVVLNGMRPGALDNQQSAEYRNLTRQCIEALQPVFEALTGFKVVVVLSFPPGTDLTVKFATIFESDTAAPTEEITGVAQNWTQSGAIGNYRVEQNSFSASALTYEDISSLGVSALCPSGCGPDANCSATQTNGVWGAQCVCADNYCKNGGHCEVIPDVGLKCSCLSDTRGFYSGARCETFASQTAIIGGAAGVGGALIIIIMALASYVCYSRRNTSGAMASVNTMAYSRADTSFWKNNTRQGSLSSHQANYPLSDMSAFHTFTDVYNPIYVSEPNFPSKFRIPRPNVDFQAYDQPKRWSQVSQEYF